jgi:hypothetical protein
MAPILPEDSLRGYEAVDLAIRVASRQPAISRRKPTPDPIWSGMAVGEWGKQTPEAKDIVVAFGV